MPLDVDTLSHGKSHQSSRFSVIDGLPPQGGRFTNRLKVGVRLKPPQGARLRAGSRLARTGDLEPLHILVPLLVLDIGANRRFVDRAHTRAEIPPGPQMLPPVAFPQGWELLLQQPRRPPLDELHQLRRRDLRRRRHQHVDMIRRDRPPDDGYFPRRADLTDQLSSPLRDIPAHHLIPVLRDPHHVILQVRDRVPGVTVFPPLLSPLPPELEAESLPPKGGGLRPGIWTLKLTPKSWIALELLGFAIHDLGATRHLRCAPVADRLAETFEQSFEVGHSFP